MTLGFGNNASGLAVLKSIGVKDKIGMVESEVPRPADTSGFLRRDIPRRPLAEIVL